MQSLVKKQMKQLQAAKQLDLTGRQVHNTFKPYKEFGDEGVMSKKLESPAIINYQKILNPSL